MSDALRQLAAAAQAHLRDPAVHRREIWLDAGWLRRLAALVVDLGAMIVLGVAFAMLVFLAYMLFTGDDFDGGPWSKTTAGWFFRALAAFFAVTYSLLDLSASGTMGKRPWLLEILLIKDDLGQRMRRLLIRWCVKNTPLLIHLAVAAASYLVLELHHRDHEDRDPTSFVQTMTIIGVWLPLFLFVCQCAYALGKPGRTLHDDVAGTVLCRSATLREPRGFEPIIHD